MDWEAVIGLEVHVQLNTNTKIFCGCRNEFGAEPNTNVCPVCLGFPGVLPVFNRRVLEYAIKVGLALNCQIAGYTKFDRKNYFYPDLPKAYQISQYDMPIATDGWIEIDTENGTKRIGIKRVHMEEDAGKLVHGEGVSYVDYNRAGVPLLEIVSEPDISSPDEAYEYLTTLKQIIQYLGVSDCDMEKGSLRCDANVSVRRKGEDKLGTKTEIKNLNSFKGVKSALEYEIKRQISALEAGERIQQETRLWDANKGITQSMRSKEEAHDYRYFPEPDLLPIEVDSSTIESLRSELPEMPKARRRRLVEEYKITEYDAKVLCLEKEFADYFEETARLVKNPKKCANLMISILAEQLNQRGISVKELTVSPKQLSELVNMWDEGKINNLVVKQVLEEMIETGKSAGVIVEEKGLAQVSDEGMLEGLAREAIEKNPKVVEDYRSGKKNAVMFLVGQVMKATRGKANPQKVRQLLEELLEKGKG